MGRGGIRERRSRQKAVHAALHSSGRNHLTGFHNHRPPRFSGCCLIAKFGGDDDDDDDYDVCGKNGSLQISSTTISMLSNNGVIQRH